jgi:archaemetzincin
MSLARMDRKGAAPSEPKSAPGVPIQPAGPAPIETLTLLPVGPLGNVRAEDLVERLSRRTSAPWRLLPPAPDAALLRLAGRGQVDADALLARLEAEAPAGSVLVGLTSQDLAIPIFTFVMGRARQGGQAALVSLARLDPAFYGLPPDPDLLAARAVVEVRHELGHVAGRSHCDQAACLMSFAGSVERVDVRGSEFCPACAALLPRWLRA